MAGKLFPDVLPYVVGTPATYSFAGFNGRTPADNAPEAMLSLVTNILTPNPSGIQGGAFSLDGRCLAADMGDGTVNLYELATGGK